MKKVKLHGSTLKDQLIASANDRIHNFVLSDGTVRGALVNGTRMVNEMRANHGLGILETLVLGHAYLGGTLMSANLKGNDRISMQFQCSGPLKGLSVEANAFGEVRGYLKQNPIPVTNPVESLDLSPFFGAGFLSITKYIEDSKQPYTGQVMIEYGSIAKDLANYFLTSEQTPTSFSLSIHFDNEGNVTGAGGLFLQAMPGATEKTVENLEEIVSGLPSIGQAFADKTDAENLLKESFVNHSLKILENHRVEFFCRCSEKVMKSYLGMLKVEDLKDISENGPFPLETNCHNCNTSYSFSKEELDDLYRKRQH